jgi:hypothetical protein
VNQGGKFSKAPIDLFKAIYKLIADLLKNPLGADWRKDSAKLK